jgi:hypothetical protein
MIGRALAVRYGIDATPEELLLLSPIADRIPQIPNINVAHSDRPQAKCVTELESDSSHLRHKRIILLIRDVRDVLVSMYFQNKKRRKSKSRVPESYLTDVSTFVRCPIGSLDTFLRYYSIWAEQRHTFAQFVCVRYEDLHADPKHELRRVLGALAVDGVTEALLTDAVEFASFDNMRALETGSSVNRRMLQPRDASDSESFKTRRGKVGGFAEYLTEADIEYISHRASRELPAFYNYSFLPAQPCMRVAPDGR